MELLHKGLTDQVIKTFHDVYNELDFGFMEKVYQNALFLELKSRGSKEDNSIIQKSSARRILR